MIVLMKLTLPPPCASAAMLSLTLTAPVPSVMVAPFALIALPPPLETTPRCPVAAWIVAIVLPSRLMMPPTSAIAPT